MYEDVSPEDEDKAIERVAQIIHSYGMEDVAELVIPSFAPMAYIAGHIGFVMLAPILPLFGAWGERFIFVFMKKENVHKLVQRVKELKEQEKTEKNLEVTERETLKTSFMDKIKKKLRI